MLTQKVRGNIASQSLTIVVDSPYQNQVDGDFLCISAKTAAAYSSGNVVSEKHQITWTKISVYSFRLLGVRWTWFLNSSRRGRKIESKLNFSNSATIFTGPRSLPSGNFALESLFSMFVLISPEITFMTVTLQYILAFYCFEDIDVTYIPKWSHLYSKSVSISVQCSFTCIIRRFSHDQYAYRKLKWRICNIPA